MSPPPLDLVKVLRVLVPDSCEPLERQDWWTLSKKTLFLVALAMCGKALALPNVSSSRGLGLVVSCLFHFIAKAEYEFPWPRLFEIKSLGDFACGLKEGSAFVLEESEGFDAAFIFLVRFS